jgi:hypothetical protein
MGYAQITGEIEFTATCELAPDKDFRIVDLQRQLAETRSALLCARRHGVTFDIFRDDIGQAVLSQIDAAQPATDRGRCWSELDMG